MSQLNWTLLIKKTLTVLETKDESYLYGYIGDLL